MAFNKDDFLAALDTMSVMDLNDLVKAIEENSAFPLRRWLLRLLVVAVPLLLPLKRRPSSTSCSGNRRQQGRRDQGSSRNHRSGPQGSERPGRRRTEDCQRKRCRRPMPKQRRRNSKTLVPRPKSSNFGSVPGAGGAAKASPALRRF